MKLIFLGPPGAGKGTIAKMVCEKYGIIQISTGDLFRAVQKQDTPLANEIKEIMSSGALVPDELTVKLVKERLEAGDLAKGYILDGFPRTIGQADALAEFAKIDRVINFMIPDNQIIVRRLSGRRICKSCGAIYHVDTQKSKTEGICDKCGGELYTRSDDQAEAITKRLDVYGEQTAPLIAYYEKKGNMVNIDASGDAQAILKVTCDILDKI
ncbi:MAG: adenylate kinase [Spirochaetales bacterium]|nr:adenylate kinase [Spirochaetales bacterium]